MSRKYYHVARCLSKHKYGFKRKLCCFIKNESGSKKSIHFASCQFYSFIDNIVKIRKQRFEKAYLISLTLLCLTRLIVLV